MYQNHFTKVFSYLSIFCSCLVWQKASCLDPYYQACVPKNCDNGLNISFPFYIPGQHPSYCGYPGYEIQCSKNGYPMIRLIPNESYIVDEIFYQNRSVRVHNAVVSSSNNSCLLQIRNLTLASEMSSFFLNPTSSLYLFSGCNKLLSEELLRYMISCDDANGENWGLAMLANDKNLKYALEKCKSVVVTPVEVHESDGTTGIGNYTKLLRRGILLRWTSNDCRECAQSGGHCGFDVNIYSLKCFCPDGPRAWSCNSGSKRNPLVKVVVGISAAEILGAVILYLYIRRKCFLGYSTKIRRKVEKHGNIEAFLKYELLAPKRYNYSDIKKITNSFKDELGKGGYGCVYKGILRDGSLVAVKVLHDLKGNGEEFVNEVASISKTSHVNIVSLLGFCYEGSKRALIYEFMPNGSLEKFIYNENSSREDQLGWQKLFQIAVGIARGLEYLHRGCNTKILHFDIKPHNILLNKDFCPKISDFGLAKLCPDTASKVSLLGARGTIGYIAPEVFCRNFGDVSPKSDVYSFGMMVLEMVGGMKNIDAIGDLTSEFYFPHWIYDRLDLEEIGLCAITNNNEYEIARKMTIAGLWCLQTFPVKRPSMSRVVEMLEGSMEYLEIPPKPFLSSPPRLAAADSTS